VSGTDDPRAAIDAVIFDMDGVLADSEPLHQHAIRLLLAEYGVDWTPDGRDPTVGLTSPSRSRSSVSDTPSDTTRAISTRSTPHACCRCCASA